MNPTYLAVLGATAVVFVAVQTTNGQSGPTPSAAHFFYDVPEAGVVEVWAEVFETTASYQLLIDDDAMEAAFLGGEYDESTFGLLPAGPFPALFCRDGGSDCTIVASAACDVAGGECDVPPGTYRLATLRFDAAACLDFTLGPWAPFETEFSYQGLPQTTTWDNGNTCAVSGDLDGNKVVDVDDLVLAIAAWGAPYGMTDLLEVISGWDDGKTASVDRQPSDATGR